MNVYILFLVTIRAPLTHTDKGHMAECVWEYKYSPVVVCVHVCVTERKRERERELCFLGCDAARMKFVVVLSLALAPLWVKCALNPRAAEKQRALRNHEEEEELGE